MVLLEDIFNFFLVPKPSRYFTQFIFYSIVFIVLLGLTLKRFVISVDGAGIKVSDFDDSNIVFICLAISAVLGGLSTAIFYRESLETSFVNSEVDRLVMNKLENRKIISSYDENREMIENGRDLNGNVISTREIVKKLEALEKSREKAYKSLDQLERDSYQFGDLFTEREKIIDNELNSKRTEIELENLKISNDADLIQNKLIKIGDLTQDKIEEEGREIVKNNKKFILEEAAKAVTKGNITQLQQNIIRIKNELDGVDEKEGNDYVTWKILDPNSDEGLKAASNPIYSLDLNGNVQAGTAKANILAAPVAGVALPTRETIPDSIAQAAAAASDAVAAGGGGKTIYAVGLSGDELERQKSKEKAQLTKDLDKLILSQKFVNDKKVDTADPNIPKITELFLKEQVKSKLERSKDRLVNDLEKLKDKKRELIMEETDFSKYDSKFRNLEGSEKLDSYIRDQIVTSENEINKLEKERNRNYIEIQEDPNNYAKKLKLLESSASKDAEIKKLKEKISRIRKLKVNDPQEEKIREAEFFAKSIDTNLASDQKKTRINFENYIDSADDYLEISERLKNIDKDLIANYSNSKKLGIQKEKNKLISLQKAEFQKLKLKDRQFKENMLNYIKRIAPDRDAIALPSGVNVGSPLGKQIVKKRDAYDRLEKILREEKSLLADPSQMNMYKKAIGELVEKSSDKNRPLNLTDTEKDAISNAPQPQQATKKQKYQLEIDRKKADALNPFINAKNRELRLEGFSGGTDTDQFLKLMAAGKKEGQALKYSTDSFLGEINSKDVTKLTGGEQFGLTKNRVKQLDSITRKVDTLADEIQTQLFDGGVKPKNMLQIQEKIQKSSNAEVNTKLKEAMEKNNPTVDAKRELRNKIKNLDNPIVTDRNKVQDRLIENQRELDRKKILEESLKRHEKAISNQDTSKDAIDAVLGKLIDSIKGRAAAAPVPLAGAAPPAGAFTQDMKDLLTSDDITNPDRKAEVDKALKNLVTNLGNNNKFNVGKNILTKPGVNVEIQNRGTQERQRIDKLFTKLTQNLKKVEEIKAEQKSEKTNIINSEAFKEIDKLKQERNTLEKQQKVTDKRMDNLLNQLLNLPTRG